MKSFLYLISILFLLSCNENRNKVKSEKSEFENVKKTNELPICGRWKLIELDYSQFLAEQSNEVRIQFEKEIEREFARLKNKTFFKFLPNFQLQIEQPSENGIQSIKKGTFSLNKKMDSLKLIFPIEENYKIVKVTNSELILSTDEVPKRTLYFILEN